MWVVVSVPQYHTLSGRARTVNINVLKLHLKKQRCGFKKQRNDQIKVSDTLLFYDLTSLHKRKQDGCRHIACVQFSSFQSLSHVQLFSTPWTAACWTSLSINDSQSLLTLMSIELVMPANHHILCRPLLLPPSIFLSIRVFSNESVLCIRWPKY